MLVLTRKENEQIVLMLGDETVVVRVVTVAQARARIGIIAPLSVVVHREEIARRIPEIQVRLVKFRAELPPQGNDAKCLTPSP